MGRTAFFSVGQDEAGRGKRKIFYCGAGQGQKYVGWDRARKVVETCVIWLKFLWYIPNSYCTEQFQPVSYVLPNNC